VMQALPAGMPMMEAGEPVRAEGALAIRA
jgi:hypothetical protein